MAAKFEVSQSGGGYRWVLKSQGRTLATGVSYSRRAMAEKAIESLRKVAAGATVVDLTLKPAKAAPAKARVTATRKATAKSATTARTARKTATKATKATRKASGSPRKPAAVPAKKAARGVRKSATPRKRVSRGG